MKVVISGAGRVGQRLAELLSNENHDVILIDPDEAALAHAAQTLDVATVRGSGADWQLLEEIMESYPDLYLSLTGHDETNLVGCEIAKGLGIRQTVARVRHWRYLNHTRLDFSRLFGIDYFVCPKLLASEEIYKYILSLGSIRTESYAHGAVQMRTLEVPPKWKKSDIALSRLKLPEGVIASLIYRTNPKTKRHQVIFPHGDDHFMPGDEVVLVGKTSQMEKIHTFFGIGQKGLTSAIIVGGGPIGRHVARTLSARGINVRLIEQDKETCALLSEMLPDATIIHHDGTDYSFLLGERVDQVDVVIATTNHDETNVLISLLAKEAGCEQVVAIVSNESAANAIKHQGITHIVSPLESTANRLMAIARAQSIISTSSLYDNQAKLMEVKVSTSSPIVGIPLFELAAHLPKDFLFAVIQNRGRILIARGDRILCPGDTAICVTSPKHTEKILSLF